MKHSNKTTTPLSQGEVSSLRGSNATEAIHTLARHCETSQRLGVAIHESKIDCHEFDKSNSRNDKRTAQSSLRGSGEATTKQSIILNKHKIDCHESANADSRNDDRDSLNDDFPNLPRSWQVKTLGECLDYEQPTKYIVKSTKYNDSYKIPVLTAGKSFILGYTNESDGIFTQTPVIIFDDFTTDTRFVDFHFKVKSSAMKILHPKENIDIKFVYYLMQTIQYRSDTHKRYWISQYAKIKIPIPPLEIQKRIVKRLDEAFSRIENGTKHLQSAKDNLTKYKQSLLKSAFNGTLTQDCPLLQGKSATPSLHSKSIAQSSLRGSNATEAIHTPLPVIARRAKGSAWQNKAKPKFL